MPLTSQVRTTTTMTAPTSSAPAFAPRASASSSSRSASRRSHPRQAGFTITELLVAIGIIVLLIGILLPALSKALQRAKVSQTQSTMQEFAKAIEAFQQEFGYYPGLIPEAVLASDPRISSTENAILHLMGGAVGADDPAYASFTTGWTAYTIGSGSNTYTFKVNVNEIGKGPRIAGKQYPPFFAPKSDEFAAIIGQVAGLSGSDTPLVDLPDVLDAWGQPVIYLRSLREVGDLVGSASSGQFAIASNAPYILSNALGELEKSQATSLLNPASGVPSVDAALAQIIRSPGFGAAATPLTGTPRGKFVLISAGPDGIYFSRNDGLGTASSPITNIVGTATNPGGPASIDKWDDVRVFGGG
jgi:type II secretory pathway pseudopilin PulG